MTKERNSKQIFCWQVMKCGDHSCPVRRYKIDKCWEYMAKVEGYQCEYGLCKDCIIYFCKNELFNFSYRDLEQIRTWRSVTNHSDRNKHGERPGSAFTLP